MMLDRDLRRALVALVFACGGPDRPAPVPMTPPISSRMGVHGMIVFGGEQVFLSHVPMFHEPHDVQLVVAVRLSAPAGGLPRSFSDQLYTFEPTPFSLDALRAGDQHRIEGTLYAGNFEQGGQPIARGVVVDIQRIVFDRPLDTAAAPDPPGYLAVGSRRDTTLVHLIAGAPGYDQIATAHFDGAAPSDAELTRGVRLALPAPAPVERRLAPGRRVELALERGGPPTAVTVGAELSCLIGPDFTEPCPPVAP